MGAVMPQVKGKADGNQVNAIVKELLGQIGHAVSILLDAYGFVLS